MSNLVAIAVSLLVLLPDQEISDQRTKEEQLIRLLKNPDVAVRERAISDISQLWRRSKTDFQSDQTIKALVEALTDSSSKVRGHVCYILSFEGQKGKFALGALLKAAEDHPNTREDALQAIMKIGIDTIEQGRQILPWLTDPDSSMRYRAAVILGDLKSKSRVFADALVKQMEREQHEWTRLQIAAAVLKVIPNQPAAEVIVVASIDSTVRDHREAAIRVVNQGFLVKSNTTKVWKKALASNDTSMRVSAIYGIEASKDPVVSYVPQLVDIIQNGEMELMPLAARVVLKIEPENQVAITALKSCTPWLIEELQAKLPIRRLFAVKTLGMIVTHSTKAKEALIAARNDEDAEVRAAIEAALNKK
jgi:HEAT repeat protein